MCRAAKKLKMKINKFDMRSITMEVKENDNQYWAVFENFYKEHFSACNKRDENQLEAYWCRPAGDNQELFQDDLKQRIFARLIKSYQNTTWHQVQLSITDGETEPEKKGNRRKLITDPWFEEPEIMTTALRATETNTFFQDPKHPKNEFVKFCKMAEKIVKKLELKKYKFNEEQKDNFNSLSTVVEKLFEERKEERKKDFKVSVYEEIIYDGLQEPYKTIMKMQKLLPGLGVALTCDFLKESHLCNIAKPDVHISHVFSLIDGIPYSMDLPLVKRVSEFATAVCKENPNDFCNSGAYNIDKIIWMNCSDYDTDGEKNKKNLKEDFVKKLAEAK